jgi:hypothetical protein
LRSFEFIPQPTTSTATFLRPSKTQHKQEEGPALLGVLFGLYETNPAELLGRTELFGNGIQGIVGTLFVSKKKKREKNKKEEAKRRGKGYSPATLFAY